MTDTQITQPLWQAIADAVTPFGDGSISPEIILKTDYARQLLASHDALSAENVRLKNPPTWRLAKAIEDNAKLEAERDALSARVRGLEALVEKHHDYGLWMSMKTFPSACPCCEEHAGSLMDAKGFWTTGAPPSAPPPESHGPPASEARR